MSVDNIDPNRDNETNNGGAADITNNDDTIFLAPTRNNQTQKRKVAAALTGTYPGNTPVAKKTRAQSAVPFTSLYRSDVPEDGDVASCIRDPPSVDVTMRSKTNGGSLINDMTGDSLDDFYLALTANGSDHVLRR